MLYQRNPNPGPILRNIELFGLIPGTYDIVDIVFYALSTFISVMVGYLVRRFAYDQ